MNRRTWLAGGARAGRPGWRTGHGRRPLLLDRGAQARGVHHHFQRAAGCGL